MFRFAEVRWSRERRRTICPAFRHHGRRDDIALARDLIEGFEPDAVIVDKAYDADAFVAETGADVVIPPKRNRKTKRPYDTFSGRVLRNAEAEHDIPTSSAGCCMTSIFMKSATSSSGSSAIAVWLE